MPSFANAEVVWVDEASKIMIQAYGRCLDSPSGPHKQG